jgi:hypothetical protein
MNGLKKKAFGTVRIWRGIGLGNSGLVFAWAYTVIGTLLWAVQIYGIYGKGMEATHRNVPAKNVFYEKLRT